MADVERISAEEARQEARSGRALLVCAYADESKCGPIRLGRLPDHACRPTTGPSGTLRERPAAPVNRAG
jgi:hypothetical protein